MVEGKNNQKKTLWALNSLGGSGTASQVAGLSGLSIYQTMKSMSHLKARRFIIPKYKKINRDSKGRVLPGERATYTLRESEMIRVHNQLRLLQFEEPDFVFEE